MSKEGEVPMHPQHQLGLVRVIPGLYADRKVDHMCTYVQLALLPFSTDPSRHSACAVVTRGSTSMPGHHSSVNSYGYTTIDCGTMSESGRSCRCDCICCSKLHNCDPDAADFCNTAQAPTKQRNWRLPEPVRDKMRH